MSASRRDEIRQMVLAMTVAEYTGSHGAGLLGRLFNRLVGFHPPAAVWVAECELGGESGRFEEGEPVATWLVDGTGVRQGQGHASGGTRGMYYTVFRYRFGISPDGLHVRLSRTRGPRAGSTQVLVLSESKVEVVEYQEVSRS